MVTVVKMCYLEYYQSRTFSMLDDFSDLLSFVCAIYLDPQNFIFCYLLAFYQNHLLRVNILTQEISKIKENLKKMK